MNPRTAAAGLAVAAIALGACGGGDDGNRGTVTVFAAASLTDAFRELADAFETAHPGVTARLSFAGSAILRTQALEGAPADVFASASPDEVEALTEAALVVEQRGLTRNRLALIVAEGANIDDLADLARLGLKLALADESVPAGRYAREALALADADGVFGTGFAERALANLRSNETSVRAALAKVELGEADAAIVYASDPGAAENVRAITIPERFQVAAEYRIALLTEGAAARAFFEFATSPEGMAILARYGFDALPAPP